MRELPQDVSLEKSERSCLGRDSGYGAKTVHAAPAKRGRKTRLTRAVSVKLAERMESFSRDGTACKSASVPAKSGLTCISDMPCRATKRQTDSTSLLAITQTAVGLCWVCWSLEARAAVAENTAVTLLGVGALSPCPCSSYRPHGCGWTGSARVKGGASILSGLTPGPRRR